MESYMKKMSQLTRLIVVIVISVFFSQLFLQYEQYHRTGCWGSFVSTRDIPAVLGPIFVIVVIVYWAKKSAKRD